MDYTVLTGDIVDSTTLAARDLDATLEALHSACVDMSAWPQHPGSQTHKITGFARRGGDGWQIALDSADHALRAALFLVARLRRMGRASRIAIATGAGTLPPSRDPNFGHGPAFTASGRLLDTLGGTTRLAHATGGAHHAATLLADHISQGWTQAQARALYEMLPPDPGPRSAAADRLGISRQAVDQALHAAGYPAIDAALTTLEQLS